MRHHGIEENLPHGPSFDLFPERLEKFANGLRRCSFLLEDNVEGDTGKVDRGNNQCKRGYRQVPIKRGVVAFEMAPVIGKRR